MLGVDMRKYPPFRSAGPVAASAVTATDLVDPRANLRMRGPAVPVGTAASPPSGEAARVQFLVAVRTMQGDSRASSVDQANRLRGMG